MLFIRRFAPPSPRAGILCSSWPYLRVMSLRTRNVNGPAFVVAVTPRSCAIDSSLCQDRTSKRHRAELSRAALPLDIKPATYASQRAIVSQRSPHAQRTASLTPPPHRQLPTVCCCRSLPLPSILASARPFSKRRRGLFSRPFLLSPAPYVVVVLGVF